MTSTVRYFENNKQDVVWHFLNTTQCGHGIVTSPWQAGKLRTKTGTVGTNTQFCYLLTTKEKIYL